MASKDTSIAVDVVLLLSDDYEYHVPMRAVREIPLTSEWPEDENPAQSRSNLDQLKNLALQNGASLEHKKEDREPFAKKDHFDSGYDILRAVEWAFTFVAGGGAVGVLAAAKPYILGWLTNRTGRSVKIKRGDVEIEIKGTDDLEKAIAALEKLEAKKIIQP